MFYFKLLVGFIFLNLLLFFIIVGFKIIYCPQDKLGKISKILD